MHDPKSSKTCRHVSQTRKSGGLNNCCQLGAENLENRYQPDLISSLKFEGPLKKVIGGMHHTLFLDSKGKEPVML